jgi:hypothetical protein
MTSIWTFQTRHSACSQIKPSSTHWSQSNPSIAFDLELKLQAHIGVGVECKQSFIFLVKLQDQFDLGVRLSKLFGLGMNHCLLFFKIKISTIIWYDSQTSPSPWPHCEISQNVRPRNKLHITSCLKGKILRIVGLGGRLRETFDLREKFSVPLFYGEWNPTDPLVL